MTKAAMAPTMTAPTATPIPAIAGAASPPPGEGAGWPGIVVVVAIVNEVGVVTNEEITVGVGVVKPLGSLPVINPSLRYPRLAVDLCVVEPQ